MPIPPPTLAQTLERFNREERNLLVRDILGQMDKVHPPLSQGFRERLHEKLDLDVPADAWWATDYHINWLAGALVIYLEGDPVKPVVHDNESIVSAHNEDGSPIIRKLVEGDQEDVDLLVVYDRNLIMIEAKAYGEFTVRQINSKLTRLKLLHNFYETLMARSNPNTVSELRFFLALQGPNDPTALFKKPDNATALFKTARWPEWACNKEPAWIRLQLNRPMSIREVTRCDQTGHSKADGQKWKVFHSADNAAPATGAINSPATF